MNNNPLFSVILPNYNHGSFLKNSIASVINQEFTNWELIIIDNFSNDNSDEIINSFKDSRIKIFKIQNNGVIAKSRNLGIKNAKAKWIAFLDSDDIWYPYKLSELIKPLYNDYDVVCSNEYHLNILSGEKKPSKYLIESKNAYKELLIFGNRLSTSSTIVNRDFLLKNNLLFDENVDFITVEDYDLWMQIAFLGGTFVFCNKFLGEYRIHEKNSSNNFDLHFNNLKKLLMYHINEVQNFSAKEALIDKIKPRLIYALIKRRFSINFRMGLKFLLLEIFKMKIKDLYFFSKFIFSKIST